MKRMRKVLAVGLATAGLTVFAVGPAFGTTPPGQKGYEGQPGNQGGGPAPGLLGYEGQPGNQGGG